MSLIIHFLTKDGIVAISDKRTTVDKDKENTHYMDATAKTIAFPNMVVVSHCGDNYIDKDKKISTTNFLLEIRKKYGQANGIKEIPLIILTEYKNKEYISNISLIVSGIDESTNNMMTYLITPKTSEIKLVFVCKEFGDSKYGAAYNGHTEITNTILTSDFQINWDNLTIEGAIDLGKVCLNATATAAKYGITQGVSESSDVYILSRFYGIGWLVDNKVNADSNAPNDAHKKYVIEQTKRYIKKQKQLKRNQENSIHIRKSNLNKK
jgi:hypothetical protein